MKTQFTSHSFMAGSVTDCGIRAVRMAYSKLCRLMFYTDALKPAVAKTGLQLSRHSTHATFLGAAMQNEKRTHLLLGRTHRFQSQSMQRPLTDRKSVV